MRERKLVEIRFIQEEFNLPGVRDVDGETEFVARPEAAAAKRLSFPSVTFGAVDGVIVTVGDANCKRD